MKLRDMLDAASNYIKDLLYSDLVNGSAPATPASGRLRLYAKTDKSLATKNDAGDEGVLIIGIGGTVYLNGRVLQMNNGSGTGGGSIYTEGGNVDCGGGNISNVGALTVTGFIQDGGAFVSSSPTSTTTSTYATISGSPIALAAGGKYQFQGLFEITASTAGGFKMATVASGGLTATAIGGIVMMTNVSGTGDGTVSPMAGTGSLLVQSITAVGGAIANNGDGTSTAFTVLVQGEITVNVAGSLGIRFAQQTTNASASSITTRYWRLAKIG